jgi:hypothetical protein
LIEDVFVKWGHLFDLMVVLVGKTGQAWDDYRVLF